MRHKAVIRCEACGAIILEGERFSYNNGVELKDDGISGEYFDGGECTVCQRRLCNSCGDFIDGLCTDCRTEKENTVHNAEHSVSA
jgi:hypothetical protein